jgi:SM-20-related protein
LHKIFDTLIDSFIENKIGIADNFLHTSLANNLKENLLLLYKDKSFLNAGTGNDTNVAHDKLFRSDMIYWLDRKHNNAFENQFFDIMDAFIIYLNETCYTNIKNYEFHYTVYEKGIFYKTHIDQFKNNDSRQFSMIMYLNADWVDGDGGELSIHHADHIQHISPVNGKSIFFKSNELAHEVLITNKTRLSITGWLKT